MSALHPRSQFFTMVALERDRHLPSPTVTGSIAVGLDGASSAGMRPSTCAPRPSIIPPSPGGEGRGGDLPRHLEERTS